MGGEKRERGKVKMRKEEVCLNAGPLQILALVARA
jgi:hypothetical protein